MTGPDLKPTATSPPSRRSRNLRRALTWLTVIVLFVILFKLIPPGQVLSQLKDMSIERPLDLLLLFGASCIIICGVAVLDGSAMWYCFKLFNPEIKWKEIVKARAAMMLLASIATLIGQAGLAVHVSRKHKIPAGTAAGMVMFLFLLEIYGMIAVATLALPVLLLAGTPNGNAFRAGAALVAVAWPLLLAFIALGRRMSGTRIFERLRLAPLLVPLRTISNLNIIRLLLFKTALALWQVLMTIVVFRIYGLAVPVAAFFFYMPIAILISSIPITPARLGTTQFSWVFFMSQFLPREILVAFSLLLQFLLNVARWVLGLIVLPMVYRDVTAETQRTQRK
jgi:uncharacterized membrane protein YbhN (UPF0104 family)